MHDLCALVVDDSKVGRLTMLKRLEAIGVRVDLTESGQQALDYLAQHRPDLIFMDHMMPDMDGFEVTQLIKAAPATRDIPVVIVSGSDDVTFVEQARAIGAINAITKPPAAGVLETILASLPKAVAEPAVSVAVVTSPVQVALEPTPVPSMDRAAVHALVEQLLGGALEPLRDDLLVQIGKQVEAELDSQRQTLQQWNEGWREQLEQNAAGMAELRRGAVDAETLVKQLIAIEQRLLPLEAEAGKPLPDLNAVQENIEQWIASGLAELQARSESQETQNLRQELLARVDEHSAQVEQRAGGLDSRLQHLSADLSQLADEAQAAKAALEQRYATLDQRLGVIENSPPALDVEALLAAMDDQVTSRLEEMRNSFGAQLEARTAMPLDDAERDHLLAPLREQLEAWRAELDGQRAQVEALEQTQRALQAGLTEQNEALQARMDAERDSLLACQAQEQAQLAARLETHQQQDWDQGRERLQALEQKLDAIARTDVDAHVQRVLEQRIAQMREVIATALQPDYPARVTVSEEPVAPQADTGGNPLQAEVDQLKGKVKTLLISLAVGGAALLVAIGMLVFRG